MFSSVLFLDPPRPSQHPRPHDIKVCAIIAGKKRRFCNSPVHDRQQNRLTELSQNAQHASQCWLRGEVGWPIGCFSHPWHPVACRSILPSQHCDLPLSSLMAIIICFASPLHPAMHIKYSTILHNTKRFLKTHSKRIKGSGVTKRCSFRPLTFIHTPGIHFVPALWFAIIQTYCNNHQLRPPLHPVIYIKYSTVFQYTEQFQETHCKRIENANNPLIIAYAIESIIRTYLDKKVVFEVQVEPKHLWWCPLQWPYTRNRTSSCLQHVIKNRQPCVWHAHPVHSLILLWARNDNCFRQL